MRNRHQSLAHRKGGVSMTKQLTFEEMYERYNQYRRVCGRKEFTTYSVINRFYNRRKNYDTPYLTQQMVDDWCEKSEGETNVSYSIRVFSVLSFLRYVAVEKKWVDIKIPETPPHAHETAIPHSFTDEELDNLFKACEEMPKSCVMDKLLTRMELPVMLRLMISAGLRPIETRMLRCQDVNFENGIVNIVNTKGYRQHIVVLHDSMLQLLKKYHTNVTKLIGDDRLYLFPKVNSKQIVGQLCLFPTVNKEYRPVEWLRENFSNVWYKYNSSKATAGMLRHHYAIMNINSMTGLKQEDTYKKLLALSKSMGHRSLVSTMWYYSLVPRLADIIDNLSGETYDKIIPVLNYDDI